MVGAKMVLEGHWNRPGVWHLEQHDPDPILADLAAHGLPWTCIELSPDQATAFQVGR